MVIYRNLPRSILPYYLALGCGIFFLLLIHSTPLLAQTDTVELKSFILMTKKKAEMEKLYSVPSLKSTIIDSAILEISQTQSIGDILKNNSAVFIKDYGPSGIQTPTFRGMSASHTKIYLNGLDISPSSLGQSDLSILPSYLFNGVRLNYGNTSFTEGPGAIGGGVMLQTNSVPFGKSFSAGVSYGSFNKISINGEYTYRKYKWESITRFIHTQADNNFEYRNIAQSGYPDQNQEHAKTSQNGVLQTVLFTPNEKSQFKIVLLGTQTDRELPGLMTDQNISSQKQNDGLISVQASWKKFLAKGQSNLVAGYSWSTLNYQDPAASIHSITINQKYQVREDLIYKITPQWSLKTMALLDYSSASNPNYVETESQLQVSVLAGLKGELGRKWETGVYIQPTLNGASFEMLPMTSLAFKPLNSTQLVLGVNASQNVHFPTLNDLFWVPGGRTSLLPEKANKAEFNLHWHSDLLKKTHLEFDAATFYGIVDNWVLWQPSGKGYWEAQNIKKVEHSGVEASILLRKKWQSFNMQFHTNYQYVQAINKEVEDLSLNKQLIYTPEHIFNWNLKTYYKKYWININYV
ncbi:MAG: outer membrane cobalamin receptor, partial [Dokdonia sp.]